MLCPFAFLALVLFAEQKTNQCLKIPIDMLIFSCDKALQVQENLIEVLQERLRVTLLPKCRRFR